MNEQDFNILAARLDDWKPVSDEPYPFNEVPGDYYNDLNLLMPLAWKRKLDIYFTSRDTWVCSSFYETFVTENKDPIKAIRQCLIQIGEDDE